MNWNKGFLTTGDPMVQWTLERVRDHDVSMTPKALIQDIKNKSGCTSRRARSLITFLVTSGELEYVDVYGRTSLLPSFSRPVPVSSRVILKPPDCHYSSKDDECVVNLSNGIAFGRGTHPTTVLCIRALDWIFDQYRPRILSALDIGTGTGVLALVSACLGAHHVDACDIDAVSVNEALENVRANQLEDRVTVGELCDLSQTRDLIMANLRYPTLISLHDLLSLSENGWLVLSGIKNDEQDKVRSCYGKFLTLIRSESERGWSSLVYQYKN